MSDPITKYGKTKRRLCSNYTSKSDLKALGLCNFLLLKTVRDHLPKAILNIPHRSISKQLIKLLILTLTPLINPGKKHIIRGVKIHDDLYVIYTGNALWI